VLFQLNTTKNVTKYSQITKT